MRLNLLFKTLCRACLVFSLLQPSHFLVSLMGISYESTKSHMPVSHDLCAPCQAAIRSGCVQDINGPHIPGRGRSALQRWECPLCLLIEAAREIGLNGTKKAFWQIWIEKQVEEVRIRTGRMQLAFHGTNPLRNPLLDPRYTTGVSKTSPVPPVNDLADILVTSSKIHHSDCRFRPIESPISDRASKPDPLLRVVPKRRIDPTLVKRWISHCESNHEVCAAPMPKSDLVLLLVDVKRKCLVSATDVRYFALSYVWGKADQFLLKQANITELKKENALLGYWDQIAPILKDAISFVESLAEQYLWVDTLCIVQDSPGRHSYLARMDEIYSGAVSTLVAIDASNATSSLPGVRPESRVLTSLGSNASVDVVRRSTLASAFMRSTYDARAWTFQERTLSRRCLYFLNEQLHFHCQQALWSEDRFEYASSEEDFGTDGAYPSLQWIGQRSSQPRGTKFQGYAQLVNHYSKKELSYPSDRLHAFSGITSNLEKDWAWDFIAGLPVPCLDLALMWVSTTQSLQRIESDALQEYLPSWSWVGWTDGVHYRMTPTRFQRHHDTVVELAITEFGVTTRDDVKIIQISSHGELCQSLNMPKRPSYTSDMSTSTTEEHLGLNYIPPELSHISNLLLFRTDTVPGKTFTHLRTSQFITAKLYGEQVPNKHLYRIIGRRGAAGLLMYSAALPCKLGDEYTYISILKSDDSPFIAALADQLLDPEDDMMLDNVYCNYYKNAVGRLVYVMLVRDGGRGFGERVAVGQMHEGAWVDARPVQKKICLG